MQRLGVNTIRVYNLATNADHNQCAAIFNAAGIYMILDVNSGLEGQHLDRTNPSSTYTADYLSHVFGMIEAFANYPNTLGFWAANEVINEQSSKDSPAYIRAVVRDMNDYIAKNIGRPLGVGYSAADVDSLLTDTWKYLACNLDSSTTSRINFFGLNNYEWCGTNTVQGSGWGKLLTLFSDTTIPVMFSEYGCNLVQPRTFPEVEALYTPEMGLLSGGLIYEYTQEENNYGLVQVNSSLQITLLDDYTNLQIRYARINVNQVETPNATATALQASQCASIKVSNSQFPTDFSLPARPSGIDAIISRGLTSATWWSKGSLATVSATAMPATIQNYTGQTIDNLNLVQYACDQINQPGKAATYSYPSNTPSCAYSTTRPTGSSGSGSGSGNKGTASTTSVTLLPLLVIAGGMLMGMLFL